MKITVPSRSHTASDSQNHARHYSLEGFWAKIKKSARLAGKAPLEAAFTLYLTLRAPETPYWCKTVIVGALGYFISLFDAIPDMTPVLGYTDDLGVMLAALATVGAHVTPDIREQAKQRVNRLLGSDT